MSQWYLNFIIPLKVNSFFDLIALSTFDLRHLNFETQMILIISYLKYFTTFFMEDIRVLLL